MSICIERRNGKPTGRFRVELQRGTDRYRQRWDNMKDAKADEARVKDLWYSGEIASIADAKGDDLSGMKLKDAIEEARGLLWRDGADSEYCFRQVELMAEGIGINTSLNKVDTAAVRKGIKHLERRGIANGTINRYLSRLRTFLAWHVAENNRTVPVDAIVWDWRKEAKGRIRWLSFEEEDMILSLVPANTAKLIKVAIETGCRRAELIGASLGQVMDDTFHIWKTKNDEPRSIPITPETAKLLRELIQGDMPSARSLRRHWDAARAKMGLSGDKDFVFHACRHTCATRLVDADVNLLVIKEWMGHKQIETTQRYAHVKPKNLRSAMIKVGGLRPALSENARIPEDQTAPHSNPQ